MLCSFAPPFQAGSAGVRAEKQREGAGFKKYVSVKVDERGMETKECIQVNDQQK